MNELTIESDYEVYHPGNEARVTCSWDLPEPPRALELRLVWNTAGKGDRDLKVVQTHRVESPAARDQQEFVLTLPWSPFSFSGKLISLIWALELVVLPKGDSARKVITIGPNAEEVLLLPVSESSDSS